MARTTEQFSCCRIKGRKSGLCGCVLIGEAKIDRWIVFHSTPHHHLVGWSGNEWLSQRLLCCFDPGVPGMQGCKWNAPGVIACCVKWWKTFFFSLPLLLWSTAGLLCNAAREHGLFFGDTFSFLFYFLHRDDWGILCMRVCAFLLQDTDAVDGSDGEWDVDTTLEHPSLSPSRWPFRLKTLPRGWYCGSPLHLHHRSVTDCKKRKILLL